MPRRWPAPPPASRRRGSRRTVRRQCPGVARCRRVARGCRRGRRRRLGLRGAPTRRRRAASAARPRSGRRSLFHCRPHPVQGGRRPRPKRPRQAREPGSYRYCAASCTFAARRSSACSLLHCRKSGTSAPLSWRPAVGRPLLEPVPHLGFFGSTEPLPRGADRRSDQPRGLSQVGSPGEPVQQPSAWLTIKRLVRSQPSQPW